MYLNIPRPTFLGQIPDGIQGTRQTLEIMKRLVRDGKRNPVIRQAALDIISNVPQKNWVGEIRAIQQFVRDQIRYTKDILGVETVQTADATLDIGHGDCDDKSVLVASLLEAIGVPTRFKAVGFSPGQISHVYVQAKIGPKWIGVETTEPVDIGWEPSNIRNQIIVTNRG